MATTFHTATTSSRHAAVGAGRKQQFGDPAAKSPRATLAFVSATSLGVDAEVRGMVRPAVPNYALRRLVVGSVAAMIIAVAIAGTFGALADIGGTSVSAAAAQPAIVEGERSASIHVAQPGDTLWSIAETHRGDVDHGRFVEVLIRLNGDTGVIAGEAIWLP